MALSVMLDFFVSRAYISRVRLCFFFSSSSSSSSYSTLKRAGALIRLSLPFLYFLNVHCFLPTLAWGPVVFLRAGLVLVLMHAMVSFPAC